MDEGVGQIIVVPDLDALSLRAAELILQAGQDAIEQRGRYMLALSGGRTPRPIFRRLALPPLRDNLDWSRVHVFWTDERCVPPDHPDSNYRLAWDELLSHVPVEHVYRMRGEAEEPAEAVREYERKLRQAFGVRDSEPPHFDLILLGLGEDGHVASLFPGSPALSEQERLVVVPYVSQLDSYRLSLTFPVLNNARCCLFVVSGEHKRWALGQVWQREDQGGMLPVKAVCLKEGKLVWLVDEVAGGGYLK